MKQVLIILTLLLLQTSLYAQGQAVSGNIIDKNTGEAVAFANVVALNEDNRPIAFCASDAEGNFLLQLPANSQTLKLTVSCLGYEHFEQSIPLPFSTMKVLLKPSTQLLKEVKVTGRAPGIRLHGDTIDYQFRKYTDGTERVLADVLAKLPGMDVNDKGEVTANGKAVDKITVNGQDFFGNQNEQVTKNMPANFIDKIQLNHNYSEYSLLDGFNTKHRTVINVDVDTLHRGHITGNAQAFSGYKDKYRSGLQLYSFGTKVMWGLSVKHYSTGEEMMSLLDYIKTIGGVQAYADFFEGETNVVNNDMSTLPYMESISNTYKRSNTMVNANLAWNPNERTKVNFYYIFNAERNQGKYQVYRQYTNTDTIEEIKRTENNHRAFHHWGLTVGFQPSATASLTVRSYFVLMPLNSENRENLAHWNTRNNSWNSTTLLSYAKRWNNKTLWTLSANYLLSRNSNRVDIDNDSILSRRGVFLQQTERRDARQLNVGSSFVRRLNKAWQLRSHAAVNLMETTVDASSNSKIFAADKQRNICRAYAAGLSIDKTTGTIKTELGGDMLALDADASEHKILFRPHLNVEWSPSAIHSLSLSWKSSVDRDNNASFASLHSITDYRHITRYNGSGETLHLKDNLQVIYRYYDILPDFNLTTYAGIVWTHQPHVYRYVTEGLLTYTDYMIGHRPSITRYAYLNMKKGFPFRVVFTAKMQMQQGNYEAVYHSQPSKNSWASLTGEYAFTTRFKSLFNIAFGYESTWKENTMGGFRQTTRLFSNRVYIQPMVIKKGAWDVSLPFAFVHDKVAQQAQHYFELSFNANRQYKRFSLRLEAHNLLHTQHFQRIDIDTQSNYVETSVGQQMPGYVVAGIQWNF